MRYMLLIYSKETEMAQMSQAESDRITNAHWAVMEETSKRGIFRGAEPLKPTATATTVRIQGNKPLITDGPFAETKEQLGAYFLVEAQNLDQAIAIAERIPGARTGSIEVRPIRPQGQQATA